jgi:hypothetical protein
MPALSARFSFVNAPAQTANVIRLAEKEMAAQAADMVARAAKLPPAAAPGPGGPGGSRPVGPPIGKVLTAKDGFFN